MAGTNTPTRSFDNIARSAIDDDSSSIVLVDPTANNADLYSMTPPAYTQSIADGESTVDAEAIQQEKPEVFERSPDRLTPPPQLPRQPIMNAPETLVVTQPQSRHFEETGEIGHVSSEQQTLPPTYTTPSVVLGHYLTEPVTTANLVGVRPCSILHDRPAIWLVKRKNMALSPLAAAVLTQEGMIRPKDLELISQTSGTRRDPTDPISGMLLGAYDSVGEIMLGLVAGPVELGRQASPMLMRYETRQRGVGDGIAMPVTAQDVKTAPHAAAQVAIGAGKGLGRIVTGSLKCPMLIMHGVTRGFHNLPKAYGEEVRQFENVTDIKSGLKVSAKSFACGVCDGLKDLMVKPIEGADKNGIVGLGTGVAKGLGNAMFKPTAGACGLIGYTSVGIYKSIRSIHYPKQDDPANLVHELGIAEYRQASDADKLHVVRVWCQTQMRVRLV